MHADNLLNSLFMYNTQICYKPLFLVTVKGQSHNSRKEIKIPQFAIFHINAEILSAYSTDKLRYFPRILHRRINTFCVLSEFAERMKSTQKEVFYFQQCLETLKDLYFVKSKGGICLGGTVYKLYFLNIFKTKTALCIYGEYREISTKRV
jgi:hypothetical protein